MNNIVYRNLLVLFFIGLCACKSDGPKKTEPALVKNTSSSGECPKHILDNKANNLNISIFLDLSDRITEPKIIQKDNEYLESVARAFTDHVKTKKLILLQDQMQLYFNPEPANPDINDIAEKLHITFTKDSPKTKILQTQELYAREPIKLYELAQADSKEAKDYPGSDIWRFFKDNVKDYAISDCHRNILVILTDGYMYHERTLMTEDNRSSYLTPKSLSKLPLKDSDFQTIMKDKEYGFIPASMGLEDLEVLVIGVQSANESNPYAIDIIREYWAEWFTAMGIQKFKIQNADIASNVDRVIADFIE